MYVIMQALPRLKPLAWLFAAGGMIGALPAFQANQLVQIIREVLFLPQGWITEAQVSTFNWSAGALLALLTGTVIFGGLPRTAAIAGRLVPLMATVYVAAAVVAMLLNLDRVPDALALIVTDAFTGSAVGGGALFAVIQYGVQRGAYSNEAGIGTEALAHGTAKTREPVREGLVAMLGPVIDTLLVCTATAVVIILSGAWQATDANGVTLTATAFETLLGPAGLVILFFCVVCFAATTIFTYSFYGSQCARFLFGSRWVGAYRAFVVACVVLSVVATIEAAIGIIDAAFGLMVIPTMVSTLMLAPKVRAEASRYFDRLRASSGPGNDQPASEAP